MACTILNLWYRHITAFEHLFQALPFLFMAQKSIFQVLISGFSSPLPQDSVLNHLNEIFTLWSNTILSIVMRYHPFCARNPSSRQFRPWIQMPTLPHRVNGDILTRLWNFTPFFIYSTLLVYYACKKEWDFNCDCSYELEFFKNLPCKYPLSH